MGNSTRANNVPLIPTINGLFVTALLEVSAQIIKTEDYFESTGYSISDGVSLECEIKDVTNGQSLILIVSRSLS